MSVDSGAKVPVGLPELVTEVKSTSDLETKSHQHFPILANGKFEIDAKVVLPFHKHVKPQDDVTSKTNSCSRWKMNQIQSRHEILHVNTIESKEKSLRRNSTDDGAQHADA